MGPGQAQRFLNQRGAFQIEHPAIVDQHKMGQARMT
jgi:hypothetical protein